MYSTNFSKHYDTLMGDYSSIVTTTKQLLHTYVPKGSNILELGCGTGNILKELKNDYTLSGLDNSEGMLTIASQKVPQASLYEADMTNFTLSEKFDAIYCVFDTINHLTSFAQWKRMFKSVHAHLKEDGIFIFDMNTVRRLERLSTAAPFVKKINANTLLCMQLKKVSGKIYRGYFQIFENLHKKEVSYIEEIVDETTFEAEVVQDHLRKNFTIVASVDPVRERVSIDTGRIFFVCRKK